MLYRSLTASGLAEYTVHGSQIATDGLVLVAHGSEDDIEALDALHISGKVLNIVIIFRSLMLSCLLLICGTIQMSNLTFLFLTLFCSADVLRDGA